MVRGRVGALLVCVLLVSCVGGKKSPPRLPHEDTDNDDPRGELHDGECSASSVRDAPAFDQPVADGMIKYAMDRDWSCGLHTGSHFDLTVTMSWGNAGCVADVTLDSDLPSDIGHCLLRRFSSATIQPFTGSSPSVQVRMTNDRAWWTWL